MSVKSYSERYRFVKSKTSFTRNANGTITTPTTTFTTTQLTGGGTRTGVSNPKYKEQIALGQCATTSLDASKLKASIKPLTFHLRSQSNTNVKAGSEYYGVWCPNYNDPSTSYEDIDNADQAALMGYYKKARRKQRQIQSGVVIGELIEVIHMIRNAAKSGRNLVDNFERNVSRRQAGLRRHSLRNSPKNRKKTIAKIMGDSWLEFAFGWTPLVSDVQDGAKALARIHVKMDREFEPIASFANRDVNDPVSTGNSSIPGSPIQLKTVTSEVRSAYVKYYGRVKVGVPGSPNVDKAAILGFQISDIVPTVWELVPWSFLIDYFTNIGDVLDALSFPRSEIAWSCKTIRTTNKFKVRQSLDLPDTIDHIALGNHLLDVVCGSSEMLSERSEVTRRVLSTLPLPSLTFKLPFSDYWKDANIAGLIASRRKRPFG